MLAHGRTVRVLAVILITGPQIGVADHHCSCRQWEVCKTNVRPRLQRHAFRRAEGRGP